MDEKIAEVANLTLRLREMSGRVMWFENLQAEKNAEAESLKKEVEVLKAKLAAQTPSAEVTQILVLKPPFLVSISSH